MIKPKKPNLFKPHAQAEQQFAKALRAVAKHSAHLVDMHVHGDEVKNSAELERALLAYSKKLEPWARKQAQKMIEKVAKKNKTAWTKNSRLMGKLISEQVAQADVGREASKLMQEQVDLIKSLPLRAGLRAQQLAQKAVYQGERSSKIAEELSASYDVSEMEAARIARTEVARANSVITQARAEAAGSEQYIWRTSGDAAVREAHKEMNGKVFDWDEPPELSDGTSGHPGTFPNCRCYPEPFFPKE